MIVSTKTIDELIDLINKRMVQHQEAINRLKYFGFNVKNEIQWHEAALCELRYIKNIIELRYC